MSYVPAGLEHLTRDVPAELFANYDARRITGCVRSSLLSATRHDLPPTIGPIGPDACLAHVQALQGLGFEAAGLHCESIALDADVMHAFRGQFDGEARHV